MSLLIKFCIINNNNNSNNNNIDNDLVIHRQVKTSDIIKSNTDTFAHHI